MVIEPAPQFPALGLQNCVFSGICPEPEVSEQPYSTPAPRFGKAWQPGGRDKAEEYASPCSGRISSPTPAALGWKPGFPLQFLAPPRLRGGAAVFPLQSLARMKNGVLPFFIFGVLLRKTPGDLSQPASLPARPWRQAASCHFSSSEFCSAKLREVDSSRPPCRPARGGKWRPAIFHLRSFAPQNSWGFITAGVPAGPSVAASGVLPLGDSGVLLHKTPLGFIPSALLYAMGGCRSAQGGSKGPLCASARAAPQAQLASLVPCRSAV
jgi:hypothetical protein